jgi:phytanoyl-CoA hydroxylase
LINPAHGSGFLTDEQAVELLQKNERIYLELAAGEAVLLHNYLPHGSGINRTDIPRRAFSVCYMDAATKTSNGERYSLIFGEGALA